MPASAANPQKLQSASEEFRDNVRAAPHGFLLADASLKLILANSDAAAILSFPGPISQNLAHIFEKKIRSALVDAGGLPANGNGYSVVKLKSGRRTYVCRAFPLNSNGKGTNGTATLFMLERGLPGRLALFQIARQFRLTHREQQAVALLLQGLSNKEIAEIMGVSANTVKAFLRLATVRMGVSSRSGIVTKILEVLLSRG
jgi:DNA-binding CsgD family transcriptional regulator